MHLEDLGYALGEFSCSSHVLEYYALATLQARSLIELDPYKSLIRLDPYNFGYLVDVYWISGNLSNISLTTILFFFFKYLRLNKIIINPYEFSRI